MKKALILMALVLSAPVAAWEGRDNGVGTGVRIDEGNLVRSGSQIQIYDTAHGEYHTVQVQTITGNGDGANVTVYDLETGEYRLLEMQ